MNKEWLYEEAIIKKRKVKDIAKQIGKDASTVSYHLKKYGLARTNTKKRKLEAGQKIGEWELLEKKIENNKGYWKCQCSCGFVSWIETSSLGKGSSACRKCHPSRPRRVYDSVVNEFYWKRLIRQAKRRDIEFSITKEYIEELLIKQNMCCALSNEPINTARTLICQKKGETSASLDRIDSNKGYIEGNVWWLHKDINFMKFKLGLERLKNLCMLIVKKDNLNGDANAEILKSKDQS